MMACAAGSDAVKIIYDVVHVQMMDGNLIENVDVCWIKCCIPTRDVPGRNRNLVQAN